MKITAVHVDTLELAMEEPFVIASSALSIDPCDLVRVETDEGITGIREACPAYEFTGDTLWTVEDVIGEYRDLKQEVVDGVSWIERAGRSGSGHRAPRGEPRVAARGAPLVRA